MMKFSLILALISGSAQAMTPVSGSSKGWSRPMDAAEPNTTFLSNQKFVWNDPGLNEFLFDRQMTLNLRQDLEDQNRDYEMRERYKLIDREEQRRHYEAMSQFREGMMKQISDRQRDIHVNKLKDFAKKDRNLRKLKNPGAVIAGAYQYLYRGEEFDIPFNQALKLRAYTKYAERRGGFKFFNPILNTGMDMMARAPVKRDAFEPPNPDNPTSPGERYHVHVWRSIPTLDVTSSFDYAFSSDTANGAISRPIFPNLTAQLDGSRVMRTQYHTASQNEGRVSVRYEVNF